MEQEHQLADSERVEEEAPVDFPRISDKLTDLKHLGRFNFQLRNSSTLEEKLSDLQVLSNTPSSILYKFLSSTGLRTIGEWVYEGSQDIPGNAQILGKVFSILKEVQMRPEYLDSAQYLGLGIEKLQFALPGVEENETRELISNVFSKYYHLNRVVLNEWLESFKRKLADPTFKKQPLSSEQVKKRPHFNKDYNNKPSYNSSNSSSAYSRDPKSNNFKPNGGIGGINNNITSSRSSSRFNRAESPPTSKKLKYNNNLPQFYSSQTPSFPKDPRKKNVEFSGENQVKRFRKEDEPNASDLTDLEVDQYQEECKKKRESSGQLFVNAQDMRSRENKLEKDNLFQLKETEKKERQQLDAMKEDIPWRTPPRLKELGAKYLSQVSVESIEKEIHKKRILCKMQCLYGGDNEIPDMPSYENVINDKVSTQEPQKIYLNKLNPEDFIQVIDMAIKNQGKQQQKKGAIEKKPLKSILKRPKEEKDRLRKKMLEEKRKTMDEEERMKNNINPVVVQKLLDLIKSNKTNSKDELISTVKSLGLSEKELHNIYQNFNLITKVLQRREDTDSILLGSATVSKEALKQPAMPIAGGDFLSSATAATSVTAAVSSSQSAPILPPPPLSAPLPPQRSIPANSNNYPNSAQQYNNTYRVQQQLPMNNTSNNPNIFSAYPGQQLPQQQLSQQQPSPYNSNKNINLNPNKLNNNNNTKGLPPTNSTFPQRFPQAANINNNTNNPSFPSAYPQPGQYSNVAAQVPQYGQFQQAPAGVPSSNSTNANFPAAGAPTAAANQNVPYNNRMKQQRGGNGQNSNYGYQQSAQPGSQQQQQQYNRNNNNNASQSIGNFNPAAKIFQSNNSNNNINNTNNTTTQSNYSQGQQQQQQQQQVQKQQQQPFSSSNSGSSSNAVPQPQSSPAISIINQYQPNSNSLPQVSLKTGGGVQSNQQYQSAQTITPQQTSSTSNNNTNPPQQPKPATNSNMSGFSMLPPGDDRERNIPCRMYHSEMGCHRDTCYFQHIPQYQGRPAPNMHKLVRPMHALSKNTERNLENTFAYNKAKFEKKSNQLGALPFPTQGSSVQQQAGAAGAAVAGGFVYPPSASSNPMSNNNNNQYQKNNNTNSSNNSSDLNNMASYAVNNNNTNSIPNSSVSSSMSGFPFGQQNPLLKQQQQMQQNQYKQQNPSSLM